MVGPKNGSDIRALLADMVNIYYILTIGIGQNCTIQNQRLKQCSKQTISIESSIPARMLALVASELEN